MPRKGLSKPIDFDGCLFNAESDAAAVQQNTDFQNEEDENEMRMRQIMTEMNNPYGRMATSDVDADDARLNQVDLTNNMFTRPVA